MKLKSVILSALFGLLTLTSCLFICSVIPTAKADGANLNSLPTQYCMRDEYVVYAQNQDNLGYCWNFASTTAAATTIMKATGEYYDFSELWTGVSLFNCSTSHSKIGDGGSFTYQYNAIKESGLMLECDLPYQYSYTVSNENAPDYYNFFERYSNDDLARCLVYDSDTRFSRSDVDGIKKHIYEHGSIYLTFTFRSGFVESNGAYYLTPNQTNTNSNHAVSVIGWDDDYQKEFYLNGSTTPTTFKGAWIILNSYTEKSGKDGLSYVFYDDTNIGTVCGYRYQIDTDEDLYFYDKIESGYEFSTNLKGAYYGDLIPEASLMKQKNIFYDDVNLEYSYVVSDGASIKSVDIYLGGKNVSQDFKVAVNETSKRFTVSRKNAPYGQYKLLVTYGSEKETDVYLNNFFVTHGVVGEEIEYDYDNSNFTFNPGRDLEFYSFILPEKNFVIYTSELNGKVSFLQTETSVYSEVNTSIPTISYQITDGKSYTATYNITTESGYTLPYRFTFEYCQDTTMQPVNVYYDLGGGINDSKNYAKELANPSTPLTLYAPTRDGYTFDGWYLDYGNGCKKVPEINGVYQVSWEDIHHMGETPTLNASSYYKKYYKNSNTLFVYARWKEIEYHYVDLTLIGNGKSVINEKISVCSEDLVRYVFTPDKGWCLSSVNVNGEEVDSKRLLQIAKYGLLLKSVDEDLSITATFSEGVYLSLSFGENVKTAYVIGSLNGVTKKFYDGDYIPAEYFKKWSVPIKKSRKNSSTERAQLIKEENLDVEESLGEYAFLKALLTPFSTQFTLVVELNEPREGYLYVLDDASSFTPVESDVFQKSITIKSTDAFKEIDVGSAVEKPVEKVEVTYGVGSYVLDHYISTDKNATSGTQNSITLNAGQIAYLFIKPYADTFYYNYEIDEDFTEISDGWYVKAYYVTADEANLGRIVVYRSHQYYTVTWLNWDGSEIYSEEYQVGEIPVFYDDRFDNPNAPTRPDDGIYSYVFTGWDKTVKTVTENVSYTATYETVLRRFTVTVEPTENGSIILPDENGYITYEDVKTYTFTPNDGYRIKDVFVNGKSIGGVDSYTFSGVTCDQTLKVEFEKIKYTVTVVCNGNGTVDCPETSLVEHGSSLTINITPSSSYVIDYIKVNGENAEISQSFTLNNLTCDAVVEIGFVKVLYESSPSDSETSTPSSESSTPSCTGSLGKNATADYFVIALCGISLAVITLIKKGKAF